MLPKVRRDKKRSKPTVKPHHFSTRRKIKKITGNTNAYLTSKAVSSRSGTVTNELLTSIDASYSSIPTRTQVNTLPQLIFKGFSGLISQQDGVDIKRHHPSRAFSTSTRRLRIATMANDSLLVNQSSDYSPYYKQRRRMKYVPYQDDVAVVATKSTPKQTTPPKNTTTQPIAEDPYANIISSVHYKKSSVDNTTNTSSFTQEQYSQPKKPQRPPIDQNGMYLPLPFNTSNPVLRNTPLLRQLDPLRLLFDHTYFFFIGPRDASVESVAYLMSQQTGAPVKYINHKNCSEVLESMVLEGVEYTLWSDVPDIIINTEFKNILPSPSFVSIYLDFPPKKIRFPNQNTRLELIKQELIQPGHLPADHPILDAYTVDRPDIISPITSDAALDSKNVWQYDGSFDYRILLTETMHPNEVIDRVNARLMTSDAYITTRSEFTSESNTAAQQRVQERANSTTTTYNELTGEEETVGIKQEPSLFEVNSFLNAVVRPVAHQGGLFVPDFPSPYLLNQHHMFQVDEHGRAYKYTHEAAEEIIEKGRSSFTGEEFSSSSKSKKKKNTESDPDATDNNNHNNNKQSNDTVLEEPEIEPDFVGQVNQVHLLPQSLHRMVHLTFLQRLQRIVEGFPLAGIRPENISTSLMAKLFAFNNDAIVTISPFNHLKKTSSSSSNQDNNNSKTNNTQTTANHHFSTIRLPSRHIALLDLYQSNLGSYQDIKMRIAESIMHGAELFDQTMREANKKHQKMMHLLHTGRLPQDHELESTPSLYTRFAMVSTGEPHFVISNLSVQDSLTPHMLLLPIKEKYITLPSNDLTKSHAHLTRAILTSKWTPLQYLQLHHSMLMRNKKVLPVGVTYYESRQVQEIAHAKLRTPFMCNLDTPIPLENKLEGEDEYHRIVQFGTMNDESVVQLLPDIAIFTHGYLELVKTGQVCLPPDRNSANVQEQLRANMGFTTLHGISRDEEGNFVNINTFISRSSPRLYGRFAPQHLSQWDHPLITPSQSTSITAQHITAENISTLFKPAVIDSVIPCTDLNMLTAAVMSRDMGTPIRKFILALDDKYKFLLPLFRDGRIPGINKKRPQDVWHLKRQDMVALERLFHTLCARDMNDVGEIIAMLQMHYNASMYIHDPNRKDEIKKEKLRLRQQAELAFAGQKNKESFTPRHIIDVIDDKSNNKNNNNMDEPSSYSDDDEEDNTHLASFNIKKQNDHDDDDNNNNNNNTNNDGDDVNNENVIELDPDEMIYDDLVNIMDGDENLDPTTQKIIQKLKESRYVHQNLMPSAMEMQYLQFKFNQMAIQYCEQHGIKVKNLPKLLFHFDEQGNPIPVNEDGVPVKEGAEGFGELMVRECPDFILPDYLKEILQREFVAIHVNKKSILGTIHNSLHENGRLIDSTTALCLAAAANKRVQDDGQLDLDNFYDNLLQHAQRLKNGDDDDDDDDDDDNEDNNNSKKPNPIEDGDLTSIIDQLTQEQQIIKGEGISITKDSNVNSNNNSGDGDDDGDNNNAKQSINDKIQKYPKMDIPIVIPQTQHPFNDYLTISDALGIETPRLSLKLKNKELAVAVLKQLQTIYAHAVDVSKKNGFQVDPTVIKSRDVIVPPPHPGVLQTLQDIIESPDAERVVRIPFIRHEQSENATKFTSLDFVINDQLQKHFKANVVPDQ